MKYYCKNCESFFEPGKRADVNGFCFHCHSSDIVEIPEYETPAQYEARTGEPFPDNGKVWIRCTKTGITGIFDFGNWRELLKRKSELLDNLLIVIASPPVPPPDDFVPEVDNEGN
ncbi:MAG: hypothetical protein LBV74_09850 [Tannerella sp.]|jgi:hypothetical protein|nr:hypothetical protein [Tannerella sp.]